MNFITLGQLKLYITFKFSIIRVRMTRIFRECVFLFLYPTLPTLGIFNMCLLRTLSKTFLQWCSHVCLANEYGMIGVRMTRIFREVLLCRIKYELCGCHEIRFTT